MEKPAISGPQEVRPPSLKVRRAIAALLAGEAKTQREASEIAGIAETNFSKALKKASVKDWIASTIKHRISTVGAIAASRVMDALVETAESEYVRADAAKYLLGIAGVKPSNERSTSSQGLQLTIVMGHDRLELGKPEPIDITPQSDDAGAVPLHITKQDQ